MIDFEEHVSAFRTVAVRPMYDSELREAFATLLRQFAADLMEEAAKVAESKRLGEPGTPASAAHDIGVAYAAKAIRVKAAEFLK